jgi:hypothetical protein
MTATTTQSGTKIGGAKLKALYTLAEISRMLGLHHQQVHRLLSSAGVEMTMSGRSVWVPLSELETKLPRVLESVVLVEALRAKAGERTRGTRRTVGDDDDGDG